MAINYSSLEEMAGKWSLEHFLQKVGVGKILQRNGLQHIHQEVGLGDFL